MSAHFVASCSARLLALGVLGGGIAWGALFLFPGVKFPGVKEHTAKPRPAHSTSALLDDVPVAFVPNLGQWDHPARYVARFGAAAVFLEDDGLWLNVPSSVSAIDGRADAKPTPEPWCMRGAPVEQELARGVALRLRFVGALSAELVPEQPLAGKHGYFLGNDPSRWRADVPQYGAVRYRSAYPGVDVRAYSKDGHLEYDLELSPAADLAQVEIEVEGAERLSIDAAGTLVLDTAMGRIYQPRPQTWEISVSGNRRVVACDYHLRGARRFGFAAPDWGHEGALVVDPGLIWSTFVGGTSSEAPGALWVDAAGVVTIAGGSSSTDYPSTPGAWSGANNGGSSDVVVTRLDPSLPAAQQLVYSTFIGGRRHDGAVAIVADAAGVMTIASYTSSTDYPTTPGAWDTTLDGQDDAFVTQLDPSLPGTQQLVYSTFLGGGGSELPNALSVDASGVVTITGITGSPTYPTTPLAWDTVLDGLYDIFVTQLDPSLPAAQQLVYSTFLGGSNDDSPGALSVDRAGVITIAGGTNSLDYPWTPNAWRWGPAMGAIVSQLDPSLPSAQQLIYSTYTGGDGAAALWVDAAGVVTIAGSTTSAGFPTTPNAYDRTFSGGGPGGGDAFVTRFDPSLPPMQQLLYSTYLGDIDNDHATDLSVDAAGLITVAGLTGSPGFPTTPGAFDRGFHGSHDVFVTTFDILLPPQLQLVYSTFLGGNGYETVARLVVDAAGVATVAGSTQSPDFPTTAGAWGTTHKGSYDVFVTRLHLLPDGARTYGASTPGCTGALSIGASSHAKVGNVGFALLCSNAPPNRLGAVILGAAERTTPIVVLGAGIWMDPYGSFYGAFTTSSGPDGSATLPLPIPLNPWLAGKQFHAQWFWVGPTSPSPCPPLGISASNALEVTFQP